eukprot:512064-Lingulodinium_polyedra.AAC.1
MAIGKSLDSFAETCRSYSNTAGQELSGVSDKEYRDKVAEAWQQLFAQINELKACTPWCLHACSLVASTRCELNSQLDSQTSTRAPTRRAESQQVQLALASTPRRRFASRPTRVWATKVCRDGGKTVDASDGKKLINTFEALAKNSLHLGK